jgi:hypothetical protein
MAEIAASNLANPPALTAEAAQTRLNQIKQDPGVVERYMAGDTAVVNEMRDLHRVLSLEGPPAQRDQVMGGAMMANLKNVADLSEAEFEQIRSGSGVYEHEKLKAQQLKQINLRDENFVRRWLSGDRQAVTEMTRISMILGAPTRRDGT